jgi:hypothetical protein
MPCANFPPLHGSGTPRSSVCSNTPIPQGPSQSSGLSPPIVLLCGIFAPGVVAFCPVALETITCATNIWGVQHTYPVQSTTFVPAFVWLQPRVSLLLKFWRNTQADIIKFGHDVIGGVRLPFRRVWTKLWFKRRCPCRQRTNSYTWNVDGMSEASV